MTTSFLKGKIVLLKENIIFFFKKKITLKHLKTLGISDAEVRLYAGVRKKRQITQYSIKINLSLSSMAENKKHYFNKFMLLLNLAMFQVSLKLSIWSTSEKWRKYFYNTLILY